MKKILQNNKFRYCTPCHIFGGRKHRYNRDYVSYIESTNISILTISFFFGRIPLKSNRLDLASSYLDVVTGYNPTT